MASRLQQWATGLPGTLPPAALVRAFVAAVCIAIIGLTAWRVHLAREVELREGRIATSNLARSLADHAHTTIEMADTLVTGLIERLEADGTDAGALARLHTVMAAKVAATTRVRDLLVFAPDGRVIASSLAVDPAGSATDRAFFAWHLTHADRGPHLGPPVQSRHNGRWTLTVSRRFDTQAGTMAGVVVATIDIDMFSSFYASFDIGAHGSIALVSEDGSLLLRVPAGPSSIGADISDSGIYRAYRQQGPIGSSAVVSRLDGVARRNSFRKVDAYPLVVFVSLAEIDILAQWRADSLTAMLAAGTAALALGWLGLRLAKQITLRHRAETELRRSEKLYRLLADSSTDLIIQSTPDFNRSYVSPASKALLGYEPEELLGQHPREIVHPDDWPHLCKHMAKLVQDGQTPPISYRARHKNGAYVWVEATGRQLSSGGGSVVSLRDISARKQAEELLHTANNQLQRMVMLDGLTGIANRRCFDLALQKEIRRAARAEVPLTALLIDVDHFKSYNDNCGHPAGDACLRSVANALRGAVHRPADVVARYGGEEFVVLLPETDSEGAVATAERIRAAVRGLAVPHLATPAQVITVSVGVAVIWPNHAGHEAEHLIAAADTALYEAKRMGRDRVRLATGVPAPAQVSGRPSMAEPLMALEQDTPMTTSSYWPAV